MSNYLITGYWGEPHVTAENDRGINAAIFGTGRFVLPVGEQFKAEYIGNNTVRMYDGKLLDNGAAAGIPAGKYIDLLIPEAGQGMKRNDLIVFQYERDASTLIESGRFVVISGAETSGTATDPRLTQQDLMTDKATFDQMAMWRVSVSGAAISAPVKVFALYSNKVTASNLEGTLPLSKGGTGATKAADALKNFGINVTAAVINFLSGVTSNIQEQLNKKASLDGEEALTNKTYNGYTLGDACAKGFQDSSSAGNLSGSRTDLCTERDIFNGLPTINGSHSYTSSTNIYAPTSVGTKDYILKSNGSGAPTWSAPGKHTNTKIFSGTGTFSTTPGDHMYLAFKATVNGNVMTKTVFLGEVALWGSVSASLAHGSSSLNVTINADSIVVSSSGASSISGYYID